MKKKSFWLLLFPVFIFSCSGNGNTGKKNEQSSEMKQETQINWQMINKGNQCSFREPKSLLIKTSQELSQVWQSAFEGMISPPPEPVVDFSKSWVVAAFMGEVMTGGCEVDMQEIGNIADSVIITIKYVRPGQGCMTSQAIEYPYAFMSVDKLEGKKTGLKTVVFFKRCD